VHVDGVGYVCSFAVFDFRRHGSVKMKTKSTEATGHFRMNEDKMEKSFLHFKATHPDWRPDPASSVFLDRLRDQVYAGGGGRGFGLEDSRFKERTKNAHGGGGGRGFGLEDSRLKERSRSYDRAWAKSSNLLRGKLAEVGEVEERDEEDEDEDEEEVDREDEAGGVEGWNRKVDEREDGHEGDEGFLTDLGMVGLLQQVLTR